MWELYKKIVSWVVRAFAVLAGIGVLVMMLVTCCDIIGRHFGHAITGAVDIVQVSACIAAICALPYTTAVKGHVAVEFLSQMFPPAVRALVDGIWRVAVIVMYGFMAWGGIVHGNTLFRRHSSTLTIHIPTFWILYVISAVSLVTILVKLYNLAHPGKEMMRP